MSLRCRKSDLVKPDHMTLDQWEVSLLSEKRDIIAQIRREVHSRGNTHQAYADRVDRALAFIKEGELT